MGVGNGGAGGAFAPPTHTHLKTLMRGSVWYIMFVLLFYSIFVSILFQQLDLKGSEQQCCFSIGFLLLV